MQPTDREGLVPGVAEVLAAREHVGCQPFLHLTGSDQVQCQLIKQERHGLQTAPTAQPTNSSQVAVAQQ